VSRRPECCRCPISASASPNPNGIAARRALRLVFYGSQLIPRWLSVWGLADTVAGLLVLFQSIAVLSSTQVVLNLPIAVQEMVLAV